MVLADLLRERNERITRSDQMTFVARNEQGDFVEQTRSYGQLLRNGGALAATLRHLGLQPRQNFAVMMLNQPEFAEAMVAASLTGAVFVPIEARTKHAPLAYLLDFAECAGIVCGYSGLDALAAALPDCPRLKWVVAVPDGGRHRGLGHADVRLVAYEDALARFRPEVALESPVDDQSAMLIMFTSGSTGRPKGVVLSYADMLMGTHQTTRTAFRPDDKFYTGMSLTHIHGLITLLNSMVLGLPVVISRRFTKSQLWEICRRYGCTVFNALGGMFTEIYSVPPRADDADNPVRMIHSSGMPANLWNAFCERFGVTLMEGYGSTEGGLLVNFFGAAPPGSIGKAPDDLHAAILDENGGEVGFGVEGEICFRRRDGQPIAVSYFKDPEASAEKTRGGWLHMGDLGHRDEKGWFYFHHRVGGGIRRNGEFINPAGVELILARHPLIADAFVYGVATGRNVAGEKTLVAAVVPSDPGRFSVDKFLAYCQDSLQKKEVPEIVQVLDFIPKSASQKPLERECIALLDLSGTG